MTGTDMVVMREASGATAGQMLAYWEHEWPPPEQLYAVFHRPTGAPSAVVDPSCSEHLECREAFQLLQLDPDVELRPYHRYTYSRIDRPAAKDERWFRGAEYLRGEPPTQPEESPS